MRMNSTRIKKSNHQGKPPTPSRHHAPRTPRTHQARGQRPSLPRHEAPRTTRAAASTSWEQSAVWYRTHLLRADTLQRSVIFPKTLALLAPQRGKHYLDIGCGEGSFARSVQITGALVSGIDASPTLVAHATQRCPRGTFSVADARRLAQSFPAASFDGATCILALQNIDPFVPVMRDAAIVLRSGAPLVIVLNHPCFRIPRQSGWGWDEQRGLQYRRIDRYLTPLEAPIEMHPGTPSSSVTMSFHRPLSAYTQALTAHGFAITAIEEWISDRTSDRGPRARAEDAARREFPMFLAIRAKKMLT